MKLPRVRLPRWLKVLLALGAVFVVGVVLPLWIWLTADIAPRDDSDLVVEARVVASGNNGFELVDFESVAGESPSYLWSTTGFDEFWDPVVGRRDVDSVRPYLDKIERALALPEFRVPDLVDAQPTFRHLSRWRALCHFLSLRSRVALDEGRTKDALDDAFRQLEFGQRVVRADGVLITYLIGASILQDGLRTLRELVQRADLNPTELASVLRRLEAFAPRREDLARCLRAYYTVKRRAIADLPRRGSDGEIDPMPVAASLTCVNETRHLVAERVRLALRHLELGPSERQPSERMVRTTRLLFWNVPTSPRNLAGRTVADVVALSLYYPVIAYDEQRVTYRATLAFVALRAYHAAHRELPDSLDSLAPAYLPAVPEDPHDGRPLRYSKTSRRVWSIGADGIDEGGSEWPSRGREAHGKPLGDPDEPTLRIEFGGE